MEFQDLIGKPFKDGARGPDAYDCWGLAMELFRRQGITLPEYPISAMATQMIALAMSTHEHEWIKLAGPQPGCLVVISISCSTWANHVGVYIGDNKFIHCYRSTGVVVDHLSRWQSRIAGYYRPGWTE